MNIKSRLMKLETQIVITDSNYCSCGKADEMHLIVPSIEDERGYCETCEGVCSRKKDVICPKCGKSFFIRVNSSNRSAINRYVIN